MSAFGQPSFRCLDEPSNRFTYFCSRERLFFAYSTMLFINETWEVFSMLAPNPALPVSLSLSQTFLPTLGHQVTFVLFVFPFASSLLPTVMDPSLTQSFFFLLSTTDSVTSSRKSGLSAKWGGLWIIVSFPRSNKALWEGFNVCKHHKCFILPMHRLLFFFFIKNTLFVLIVLCVSAKRD